MIECKFFTCLDRKRHTARILALLVLLSSWVCSAAIEARCDACRSVADAFLRRLENERVRNHLDMRHRLDKNGKRYGKVIDYKVSELRVSELLDDLCEDMGDFAWAQQNATDGSQGDWSWRRIRGKGTVPTSRRASGEESKTRGKELKNYCYSLVERTEDALSAYLSSGSEHHEGLDEYICDQLVGHCEPAVADSSDVKAEL